MRGQKASEEVKGEEEEWEMESGQDKEGRRRKSFCLCCQQFSCTCEFTDVVMMFATAFMTEHSCELEMCLPFRNI